MTSPNSTPIPLIPPAQDHRFQSTVASWTITTLLLVNLVVFFGIFATLRRMDLDLRESLNGFKHRTVERWAYFKRHTPRPEDVPPVIEAGVPVDPIFLASPSPVPLVSPAP